MWMQVFEFVKVQQGVDFIMRNNKRLVELCGCYKVLGSPSKNDWTIEAHVCLKVLDL